MQFSPLFIASIALGGAIGAVARHSVSVMMGSIMGGGFPWGTLTVNIVGSFLMGALLEVSALKLSLSPEIRALLVTGFLGAFTTFSTFSLDVATLYERGNLGLTALYIIVSVVVGISALFGAIALVRGILQ
ncbi:fluoride efflux transporter CrcB [Thalassospira lucentensis]|uniref:fluoride efflux transporter CrcB n=1 Tax=Thalassospira lucentensis TaxID=168935 RepID=UPI0003B4BA7F|nr:fluoride efflux transporter CrcB [Thalassospira lucentensis]RCK21159.1 protein CrcB [Thalassospira lucentensis MCCC 1A00383 = DSM 14000]